MFERRSVGNVGKCKLEQKESDGSSPVQTPDGCLNGNKAMLLNSAE